MTASLTAFCASTAFAQSLISGKIVDENGEPLIGASIIVPGTSQGTSTDIDGNFTLKTDAKEIQINYIGYVSVSKQLKGSKTVLGTIQLDPDAVALQDVVISQSIAVQRKTPVALSTVNAEHISYKLGGQEFPEILKSTPGVYVTKSGGGYGDSKINMRGFKPENVAVMINGVPVNGMENGKVYWSNWAGLSDVTRSMQTQRGMGAQKVASPSVGGSINVVTNSIDAKRGGTFSFGVGNDNAYNLSFSLSTGLNEKGWALSILGAKRWGDGYIQGTEYEGYNWFVNISKRINVHHQLSLTAFGAPQKHAQRSNGLTIDDYTKIGHIVGEKMKYRYNPSYGRDKYGRVRTTNFNEYHKPQISLNHQWQINEKSSLSSALYMSIGRGGGYSGDGIKDGSADLRYDWFSTAQDGSLNWKYRNPDGTFNYAAIQELNAASDRGSKMIMAKSSNSHMWYGLLSTYTNQISKSLELSAGIDVRYYIGEHNNEIIDLYDGQYYMDNKNRKNVNPLNNAAAADPNWKYQHLTVGDKIYRDYDSHIHSEGVFAQLEWSHKDLTAFVSGSISNTGYWRYDRMYYDAAHAESEHKNYLGGVVKAGMNYNINEKNNVFFNAGYISRAPFLENGVFLSCSNSHKTNPNPINEHVASVELGYGFKTSNFVLNLNGYYTMWMDKAVVKTFNMENGNYGTVNLSGVDARHMGIEMDFRYTPTRWLDITGMLSVGDWQWDSNSKGYIYDSEGQPAKVDNKGNIIGVASEIMGEDHGWVELAQKGVKVGGSAQITSALGVTVRPMKGFRFSADWNVYANNYTDYKLPKLAANKTIVVNQPYKLPWGHQMDLSASYSFKIGNIRATLYGNVNNVYDYHYIMDASNMTDLNSTWQNISNVFYAFGRTYTVRFKINF